MANGFLSHIPPEDGSPPAVDSVTFVLHKRTIELTPKEGFLFRFEQESEWIRPLSIRQFLHINSPGRPRALGLLRCALNSPVVIVNLENGRRLILGSCDGTSLAEQQVSLWENDLFLWSTCEGYAIDVNDDR